MISSKLRAQIIISFIKETWIMLLLTMMIWGVSTFSGRKRYRSSLILWWGKRRSIRSSRFLLSSALIIFSTRLRRSSLRFRWPFWKDFLENTNTQNMKKKTHLVFTVLTSTMSGLLTSKMKKRRKQMNLYNYRRHTSAKKVNMKT